MAAKNIYLYIYTKRNYGGFDGYSGNYRKNKEE